MQKENRHILSVLVENSEGVLSQVSRMFSRKGYNRFVVRENACQSVGKDQQRGGIYNSETHRNGYCKGR